MLTELGLVELSLEERRCRVLEGVRADLERSSVYRRCIDRLEEIERALAPELPEQRRARAA